MSSGLLALIGLILFIAWMKGEFDKEKAVYVYSFTSPFLESMHQIIEAYFCGLPQFPYRFVEQSSYQTTFSRGGSIRSGQTYYIADQKTMLIVTYRPSPEGMVEWSVRYEVDLENSANRDKTDAVLKEEVDNFCTYVNKFARLAPRSLES